MDSRKQTEGMYLSLMKRGLRHTFEEFKIGQAVHQHQCKSLTFRALKQTYEILPLVLCMDRKSTSQSHMPPCSSASLPNRGVFEDYDCFYQKLPNVILQCLDKK